MEALSKAEFVSREYRFSSIFTTFLFLRLLNMPKPSLGSFLTPPIVHTSLRHDVSHIYLTDDDHKIYHSSAINKVSSSQPPQKILKDILSCGLDSDKALHILYKAYPYLESDMVWPIDTMSDLIIDSRSICAILDILKKLRKLSSAVNLLESTVQTYIWNKKMSTQSPTNNNDEFSLRSVYKSFISLSSNLQRADLIVYILTVHMPYYAGLAPTLDMMHATLSAFGKCERFDLVLEWLEKMEKGEFVQINLYSNTPLEMDHNNKRHDGTYSLRSYTVPVPDRLAYQTASSAFSNVRRGREAAVILRRMQTIGGFNPDIRSYNQILAAFSRDGSEPNRATEAIKILTAMEEDPNIIPNETSYEMVISICMRENEWGEAARLIRRLEGSENSVDSLNHFSDTMQANERKVSRYIDQMTQYTKIGSGREGWYQLGTYQSSDLSISFGFHIHRNPQSNGLSFVFYNQEKVKLGFILVRHTVERKEKYGQKFMFSDLMGMYVDEKIRGKGLANIFLALWLKVLVCAGILPRTEIINKPLLSLVLTRFGFVPRQGGFEVIVSAIPNSVEDDSKPLFTLYSPTLKHLHGIFGERERRVQRISVCSTPPEQGGKATFVKTFFDHPWSIQSIRHSFEGETTKPSDENESFENQRTSLRNLNKAIDQALPGCTEILYKSDELTFALFGFMLET